MWKIDSDGNAFNSKTNQFVGIHRDTIFGVSVFIVYMTIGKKGFKIIEVLTDEFAARNLVAEIVDKLREGVSHEETD